MKGREEYYFTPRTETQKLFSSQNRRKEEEEENDDDDGDDGSICSEHVAKFQDLQRGTAHAQWRAGSSSAVPPNGGHVISFKEGTAKLAEPLYSHPYQPPPSPPPRSFLLFEVRVMKN